MQSVEQNIYMSAAETTTSAKSDAQILKAWLNFISFVERNRFSVIFDDESAILASTVRIEDNFLKIKNDQKLREFFQKLFSKYAVDTYDELFHELKANQNLIGLTWPLIWSIRKEKFLSTRVAYPLFLIDITESLIEKMIEIEDSDDSSESEDEIAIYLLDQKIEPITEQLLFILGFDLEEIERKTLFVESPLDFLSNLFLNESEFSLEDSVSEIANEYIESFRRKKLEIQKRPYIFEVEYTEYSSLRRELYSLYRAAKEREILIDPSTCAKTYLSLRANIDPLLLKKKSKISYGLCQRKIPDQEQIEILKNFDLLKISAIFGPPGSGKTYLTREILARSIVDRCLDLARGEERSGLYLVSSSVKRAISNVVEFFEKIDPTLKLTLDISEDESSIRERIDEQIKILKKSEFDPSEFERAKSELLRLKDEIDQYLRKQEQELPEKEKEIQSLEAQLKEIELKFFEIRRRLRMIYALLKPFHSERHFFQYYLYLQNLYYRIQAVRTSLLAMIIRPLARWYEMKLLQEAQDELSRIAIPLEMDSISTFEDVEEAFSKLRSLEKEILSRKDLEAAFEKYRSEISELNEILKIKLEEKKKLEQIEFEKRIRLAYNDEKFRELNLSIFSTSISLLKQFSLFHKTRVIEFLILLRDALIGIRNPDRRESREAVYLFEKSSRETLYWTSFVFPIICSNALSFSEVFPFMISEIFDLAIIDEAAYVEPQFVFPILYRSKKAVFSGDNKQLKPPRNLTMSQIDEYHRISFSDKRLIENFSPAEVTALDRARLLYKDIFHEGYFGKLKRCRRSHPEIVQYFSRIGGYNLISEFENEDAETKKFYDSLFEKRVVYINCKRPSEFRRLSWTENPNEAAAIRTLIKYLLKKGVDRKDISVITPYVKQERRLIQTLKDLIDKENIGTVHKFQGRENRVVIFSPVIWNPDHRKIFFSSESNLLNTAASRAISLFVVVADFEVLLSAPRWLKVFADTLIEMGREVYLSDLEKEVESEGEETEAISSTDDDFGIKELEKLSSERLKSKRSKSLKETKKDSEKEASKSLKRKKLLRRKKVSSKTESE